MGFNPLARVGCGKGMRDIHGAIGDMASAGNRYKPGYISGLKGPEAAGARSQPPDNPKTRSLAPTCRLLQTAQDTASRTLSRRWPRSSLHTVTARLKTRRLRAQVLLPRRWRGGPARMKRGRGATRLR